MNATTMKIEEIVSRARPKAQARIKYVKKSVVREAFKYLSSEGYENIDLAFGLESGVDFKEAGSALCLIGTKGVGSEFSEFHYELEDYN